MKLLQTVRQGLVFMLVLASLLLVPSLAAEATAGPPGRLLMAPEDQAGVATAVPCSESPFGGVVELGKEREIFLGFRDTDSPSAKSMGAYRFDRNPANGTLQEKALITDSDEGRSDISWPAATAADLDGDGKTEFLQGFTDAGGQYQIVVHGNGKDMAATPINAANHSRRAMAAGDLLGLDDEREQVVIASRSAEDVLTVAIWAGSATGIGEMVAVWRATVEERSQATLIDVATGNLDNDGYDDIAVAFLQNDGQTVQIVYLEYAPDFTEGTGSNYAFNLRMRAFTATSVDGNPAALGIEMADLNGDAQDSIVLATDTIQVHSPGLSPGISVRTFDFDTQTGALAKTDLQWSTASNSFNFALATGDIDADYTTTGIRRDEIIVGYYSAGLDGMYNGLNIKTLRLINLDTANPELASSDHWWDNSEGRNVARHLALAVDDLDRDNRDDVVAAFSDDSQFGFQLIYLAEQFGPDQQPSGLQLMAGDRFDATFDAEIQLVLGDWDNDSLKAFAQGKCARVVENQITAMGFIPPFWQNIQGDQIFMGGSLGRSVSQEAGTEESLAYLRSHTVSAYAGVGASGSLFDIVKFGASAKATAAREYATSNKRTTGTTQSTITTVGRSWGNDSLVYEPAEYKCYSYQIADGGTVLSPEEAAVRFCEYLPIAGTVPLVASELNSWDKNLRSETEWTPVLRDWSSLALFRGAHTAQSGNGATAPLAVDSEIVSGSFISGTVAQTNVGANPWWQVDLGSVQTIDKIRLWSPDSYTNLHLFVAAADFRTLNGHEDPANLIGAPGVRHFTLADLDIGLAGGDPSGRVTTFLTRAGNEEPIRGRYVRVQVAGTAALALAEVQVFGPNHIEPDRYPLDLKDDEPGDGALQVLLYNPFHTSNDDRYQWVQSRGNLLWDGRQNSVLNALLVDRGNTSVDWSLSKETVTTTVTAEEITNNTSIGAEFDVEAGIVVQLQAGYGEEYTAGVASETVQTTSWGTSFDMGGQMAGFPAAYDGPAMNWVVACRYRFQPYYYEIVEESSIGYRHRFPVLDYLVPDAGRQSDLDREATLDACRNGNLPSSTPQPSNDTFTAGVGISLTLNVLANDLGNNLEITNVGAASNGTVSYTTRSITYTPNPGFQGTDHFDYTVFDGVTSSTARVTVTVGEADTPQTLYLPAVVR